jgi:hypothetical protein
LLTEIANEAHVSWKDLRWFAVGGDKPRSIVIVRRGANKKSVKTISEKRDPVAWESWKPVLADLKAEKQKTNKRRVSHKKLQTGRL